MTAWIGVGVRAYRSDTLGRWWWAATLLATAATVAAPGTAALFDAASGRPGLALGLSYAAVTAAAALAVRAQLATAAPTHQLGARVADTCTVAVPTLLAATALAAPIGLISDPTTSVAGPAVLVVAYWSLYYTALGAGGIVFALVGAREVRDLTAGQPRTVAGLLVAAGVATTGWAVFAAIRLAATLTATSDTGWSGGVRGVAAVGAGGFLALAAACALTASVVAVLHRRGVHRRPDDHDRDVMALWNLLCGTSGSSHDLFGVVIETRDAMWVAQRWVGVDELAGAARLARRLGLTGIEARAFTTAVCLELGTAAIDEGRARRGDSADLSRLGGGVSVEAEAAWLGAVWRAHTDHHAAAAAAIICGDDDRAQDDPEHGGPGQGGSISGSGRGTVIES